MSTLLGSLQLRAIFLEPRRCKLCCHLSVRKTTTQTGEAGQVGFTTQERVEGTVTILGGSLSARMRGHPLGMTSSCL